MSVRPKLNDEQVQTLQSAIMTAFAGYNATGLALDHLKEMGPVSFRYWRILAVRVELAEWLAEAAADVRASGAELDAQFAAWLKAYDSGAEL